MCDSTKEVFVSDIFVFQSLFVIIIIFLVISLQQLLSTYSVCKAAPENLELILEKMRVDGLQPDLKTYKHILDL